VWEGHYLAIPFWSGSAPAPPGFRKFKFSATGADAGWPNKLKAEAEKKGLGMWQMGGVNCLTLLASNDASSGGEDDASTEQARSHVQEVIDTPP